MNGTSVEDGGVLLPEAALNALTVVLDELRHQAEPGAAGAPGAAA